MAHLVLASQSPRRQELLRRIGLTDFSVRVPQTDESAPEGLSPTALVEHICRQKAIAARSLCTAEEVFLTADTMVFLDDQRLGKPKDAADALRMLTALQGRRHLVCTGVTVGQGERLLTQSESTWVRFRPATQEQLAAYVRTGEPLDKAGAYGIQGKACVFIRGIQGDYYNVVGLPVCALHELLKQVK